MKERRRGGSMEGPCARHTRRRCGQARASCRSRSSSSPRLTVARGSCAAWETEEGGPWSDPWPERRKRLGLAAASMGPLQPPSPWISGRRLRLEAGMWWRRTGTRGGMVVEDGDKERQRVAAADGGRVWGRGSVLGLGFIRGKFRALGGLFAGLRVCTRPFMTVFKIVSGNPSCINRFLVVR